MYFSIHVLTYDPNFRPPGDIQVVPIGVRPPRRNQPGSTLDRSILLDPPAAALVPPKFEFSKLENGAVGSKHQPGFRMVGGLGLGWGVGWG